VKKNFDHKNKQWEYKGKLETPPHVLWFCQAKNYVANEFDPMEKQFWPLYLTLFLILIFLLWEQTKSSNDKIAYRVYKLLKEDLRDGKFRNGIRVDDIFLCYGVLIDGSRDYFYSKILPKMEKKIASPSSSIEKTLNRSGILVWRLKREE